MRTKLSMKQQAFAYMLDNLDEYIPTYEFVGEKYVKCIDRWCFMSYKAPARLSDIYNETRVLDRKHVTGKSNAKYYTYKINREKIKQYAGSLPKDYEVVLSIRRESLRGNMKKPVCVPIDISQALTT